MCGSTTKEATLCGGRPPSRHPTSTSYGQITGSTHIECGKDTSMDETGHISSTQDPPACGSSALDWPMTHGG